MKLNWFIVVAVAIVLMVVGIRLDDELTSSLSTNHTLIYKNIKQAEEWNGLNLLGVGAVVFGGLLILTYWAGEEPKKK
jgi:hypothetical protein